MNPPTIRNFTAAPSEIPPTVYDGILPVISLGIHPIFFEGNPIKTPTRKSPRTLSISVQFCEDFPGYFFHCVLGRRSKSVFRSL